MVSESSVKDLSPPRAAELAINGMSCANCVRHVTEAIQSVPGVQSASVNLDSQRAVVRWSPDAKANVSALIHAVETAGYGAKIVEPRPEPDHGQHKLSGWQLNLLIGVLGASPLIVGEWFFGMGMQGWSRWFSFVLSGIVQVFAGAQFHRGAGRQLKIGSSNMDTLVALGSTTAFGYSAWHCLPVGALLIGVAAVSTMERGGRGEAGKRGGGACCPMMSGMNLWPTNPGVAVGATNGKPGVAASESITYQQRWQWNMTAIILARLWDA